MQKNLQQGQGDNGVVITASLRDIVIVIIAFIAIVIILLLVMQKFATAGDMVAVLGVALPIISTIAAAAIGASIGATVGAQAGAKAGEAKAAAANQQMATMKHEVIRRLDDLQTNKNSVHSQVQQIPFNTDATAHILDPGNIGSLTPEFQIKIPTDNFYDIDKDIAGIRGVLDALPV